LPRAPLALKRERFAAETSDVNGTLVLPARPAAAALDGLDHRWTRLDNVPFGDSVDVEHVLVSPVGVAVVSSLHVNGAPQLRHAVSEARWRARKIGFLLDRIARVQATPVLVISGPGAPVIAGGCELLDGVLVGRADDADGWIAHLECRAPVLDAATVGEMVDVLVAHTRRTEQVVASFA
jgi:hypothetical protein